MTLGEKLKSIRKLNKLNQSKFSLLIGISQATLSELEKDKYKPSLETILSIKNKFNVNFEWLLLDDTSNLDSGAYRVLLDADETDLVSNFRELSSGDKQEIIEIMELKIKRNKVK